VGNHPGRRYGKPGSGSRGRGLARGFTQFGWFLVPGVGIDIYVAGHFAQWRAKDGLALDPGGGAFCDGCADLFFLDEIYQLRLAGPLDLVGNFLPDQKYVQEKQLGNFSVVSRQSSVVS
jgi:hypothetical protein